MSSIEKTLAVIKILRHSYSGSKISLNYSNSIQLLVAVMLSAQCTDVRVNIVTEKLFRKYTTVDDFANADIEIFKSEIRSTGFYNNKAKNIVASAKIIKKDFDGIVPNSMEKLLTLPGVARKTANIVLSNAYHINEGIAVDTHMKRVNFRLGITKNTNPDRIERDLMKIIPKPQWNVYTYLIIAHGRAVCRAPVPFCSRCPLLKICPKKGVLKSN